MDPYRNPAPRDPESPGWRRPRIGPTLVLLAAVGAVFAVPWLASRSGPPKLPRETPPQLVDQYSSFPPPLADLPLAVPLAPLLAASPSDALAVTEPGEGTLARRQGEAVVLRFNRPMVEGSKVSKPLEASPIDLSPRVAGKATWTSRSALSFLPDEAGFTQTRTVTLGLAAGLQSLAGESLAEPFSRTLVLDAGPQLAGRGPDRVAPGEPLRLWFSGRVDVAALSSQLLVYEVGGGRRMLPFSIQQGQAKGDKQGRTAIDLTIRTKLDPGANIGVAVSPSLTSGGSHPRVMTFELAPRPHIEGIDCPKDVTDASGCSHQSQAPGEVVEIEEELTLLSTANLGPIAEGSVRIVPEVPGLTVKVTGKRRIVIRGDWPPGQVVEVRIAGLVDDKGRPLDKSPPLAVRSAGRAAEVRIATGRQTIERDAKGPLPFWAIHVDEGEMRVAPVPEGLELAAFLNPHDRVSMDHVDAWKRLGLQDLAPTSKKNRWGRGQLAWEETPGVSGMAVLAILADRHPRKDESIPTTVLQRTDLGIDARLLPRGALVWVTSLSTAQPVAGARVTLGDHDGQGAGDATTDADGSAWIPLSHSLLEHGGAVRAVKGDDRAVVVIDPRGAIGPSQLGVSPGEAPLPEGSWVATVMTDRGICRPGEVLHAKAVVRTDVGGSMLPPLGGSVHLQLFGPSGEAPVAEQLVGVTSFGTASADFALEANARAGKYRVEVKVDGQERAAGSATVSVGEYHQPTFRVDLETPAEATAGDTLHVDGKGAFMFGPPAAGLQARWSIVRSGTLFERDSAWDDYTFDGVDTVNPSGTMAAGDVTLDSSGKATIDPKVALLVPVVQEAKIEVTIRDVSGDSTSARKTVKLFPATDLVGIKVPDKDFADPGAMLDVETIVLGHDGKAVSGRKVEARIVREGWHSYWEWSGKHRRSHRHAEDDEAQPDDETGVYQSRKARKVEVVKRCDLTSAAAPVKCSWQADRGGTYVLEATVKDEKGRVSLAAQRLYVAAPGEHPDRDPPGSAVTVTPSKKSLAVGESFEVAFESPFPDAEARLTVEREGVLHTERRRVGPGGSTFKLTATKEMVPNAFVSLALVKPRTGQPAADHDLEGPDLRVGLAEVSVTAKAEPLGVKIDLPGPSARAGTGVPVTVHVTDAEGHGVAAEVALYAVDEGTLRVTGYESPDPTHGLWPRLGASFAWEDLRRSLLSRLMPAMPPSAGGDGGGSSAREVHEDRGKFEPTPLWAPHLVSDTSGNATAVLPLPDRAAEYRIMAVALDKGVRTGSAKASFKASQPIVVRPALPSYATAGDRFEAAALIHNTEDEAAEITVTPIVAGQRLPAEVLKLGPHGEARVKAPAVAGATGDVAVRFEAKSSKGEAAAEAHVTVRAKGREVRTESVGAVTGRRTVTVRFPEGAEAAPGAMVELTVAGHPFVGFDTALESLLSSPGEGVAADAASLIALAADAQIDTGKRPSSVPKKELEAQAKAALKRLLARQTAGGGFGESSSHDSPNDYLTAYALHALTAARKLGLVVEDERFTSARRYVAEEVKNGSFTHGDAGAGLDDLAFAVRVLAESDAPEADRMAALFEQRDRLSPFALSQVALALPADDRRRDALVLEAARKVLVTEEDERKNPRVLRWYDSSPRVLGAVLEASSAIEVGAGDAPRVAERLLSLRENEGWYGTHATSQALAGLAAYAKSLAGDDKLEPKVVVDGAEVKPEESKGALVHYRMPFSSFAAGEHSVTLLVEGTAWYSLSTRMMLPLGPADEVARGEGLALHREFEDASGKPLGPEPHVKLGDLVRVRLYLYAEQDTPAYMLLDDPLAGGVEAVDESHETNAHDSLLALLGMGPDDDAWEGRGQLAQKSLGLIDHRVFAKSRATHYLNGMSRGLHEVTYGVRASAAGTFVLPPAEVSPLYSRGFKARSRVQTLVVEPR